MKFSRWQGTAAALALVASLCAPSWVTAQTGTGTIDGRVHDESRASLPGATVTAKNVATGLTRTATVERHRDLSHQRSPRRHLRRDRRRSPASAAS